MSKRSRLAVGTAAFMGMAIVATLGVGIASLDRSFAQSAPPAVAQPLGAAAGGDSDDHVDEGGAGKGHAEEGGEHAEQEDALKLTAEQIDAAGIELVKAAGRAMSTSVSFAGEIRFDEDRTSHIVAPLSGVVEAVKVDLGETVRKGQVLAVIASPEISQQRSELSAAQKRFELARLTASREQALWEEKISPEQDYLQARQAYQEAQIELSNARQKMTATGGSQSATGGNRYELKAPFDGVIVEKHLGIGERVDTSTPAFIVSDLSRVWATFGVPPSDLAKVAVGSTVTVSAPDLDSQVQGRVGYVGSLLGEQNRAAPVRVTLANPQGVWRPGLFVTVSVAAHETAAAVVVPQAALQTIEDKLSVFVRTPEGFKAEAVETGRRDGGQVEILKGLDAGAQVAAAGSFILKSELGKASAEHGH